MKHSFLVCALIGAGLLNVATVAAQDKSDDASAVTVTGCLAQGDQANEYSIKDNTGKTYGLMGGKVNLKAHLGHQVTITGTPTKMKESKDKSAGGAAAGAEESQHLRVSDLK